MPRAISRGRRPSRSSAGQVEGGDAGLSAAPRLGAAARASGSARFRVASQSRHLPSDPERLRCFRQSCGSCAGTVMSSMIGRSAGRRLERLERTCARVTRCRFRALPRSRGCDGRASSHFSSRIIYVRREAAFRTPICQHALVDLTQEGQNTWDGTTSQRGPGAIKSEARLAIRSRSVEDLYANIFNPER